MFNQANKADFERMLDDILSRALTAAGIAGLEVEAQFVKAGGIRNSRTAYRHRAEDHIFP